MTQWLLVLLGLAMVLACALFVAAEFAMVTVNRATVERAASKGDRQAQGVLTALRSLSTQLSGAQVGITVTNITIGYLAEPSVAQLIDGPIQSLGVSESTTRTVAFAIAIVVANGVTMVFGELVPKNLAIARPFDVAKFVQRPQRIFTTITRPLTVSCNAVANAIVRLFGVEPQEELKSARLPEELASLVRRSAESGTLPERTATLVERTLRFDDKIASDVLTPRTKMVTVPARGSIQHIVEMSRQHGFSRFPVVLDDVDDVVGMVELAQAMKVPRDDRGRVRIREIMNDPILVPASLPLDELLWRLREENTELAVVADEYGGTAGLVTFEDLVEEIVGSIEDEHDQPTVQVRRTEDGGWQVSGLLRPDELADATGIRLKESRLGHETIAGLLLEQLGRIPTIGDEVVVDQVHLVVEKMDRHRVEWVRLYPPGNEDEGDA